MLGYQFDFRKHHGTKKQIQGIIENIQISFEKKNSIDVVRHKGLVAQLRKLFSKDISLSSKPTCELHGKMNITLQWCAAGQYTGLYVIYSLYTANMSIEEDIFTSTFTGDTAILLKNYNLQKIDIQSKPLGNQFQITILKRQNHTYY